MRYSMAGDTRKKFQFRCNFRPGGKSHDEEDRMLMRAGNLDAAAEQAKPSYNVPTLTAHTVKGTETPLETAAKPQVAENPAELALIDRICKGEKELYYSLIQPYERALFIAAQSILKNEADAEDVAQEAALKGLKYLGSFRRESKFSTWLIQIAVNEARMKLRKDRRHLYDSIDDSAENEEGDYIPRDFADWREIPSETLHRKELRDAIQKALDSLAPKYREVFILRDVQKLDIKETAAALGITEASVKTRLLRARLQMRDALAPGIDGGWSAEERTWKKVRPW
jgi:RNA polymerase sigma-70 factor, ECF subfamily